MALLCGLANHLGHLNFVLSRLDGTVLSGNFFLQATARMLLVFENALV